MTEKKISVVSGVSACVGLVIGSTCFMSVGQGVAIGGKYFYISLAVVALLDWFLALSLCELNDILPSFDGYISNYLDTVFGPAVSVTLSLMVYLLNGALLAVMEVIICGQIVSRIFVSGMPVAVTGCTILILFYAVNSLGVDVFAKVQNIIVFVIVMTLVLFGVVGCLKIAPGASALMANTPQTEGIRSLLEMVSFTSFIYLGIDLIVPLANDVKNPGRDIRVAITVGIVVLTLVYSLTAGSLQNYIPLASLMEDSTPNITYATVLFGKVGRYWMGIVVVFAAMSTVNTAFQSCSRILANLARIRLLPKILSKQNRYNANVSSLTLLMIVSLIMLIIGSYVDYTYLLMIGVSFYLVIYIFVHVSVLILRHRDPAISQRKKKVLGSVPQYLGIVGFLYVLCTIFADIKLLLVTVVTFLVLLICSCIYCKKILRIRPFKKVRKRNA